MYYYSRSHFCAYCSRVDLFFFFFFNDTATTEIYTLSLHDALPISHAPARFHHVCDLVRYRCGAFAISPERHVGHVLYVRGTIYPAECGAPRSATDPIGGDRSFGPVPRSFPADVDHRPPAEPREGGLTDHEHRVLVVLQQPRGKHSCWHCAVRSFPRRAIPLARLDLQSQPCGKGQQHRRLHAVRFSTERLIDRAVCRVGPRLWLSVVHQCAYRHGHYETHSHRRGHCFHAAPFLLRRIYLEGSRAVYSTITRARRRNRRCNAGRY